MEKKNIDWSNIGFGYMPTDYRYVSMYQNGSWDEGALTSDPNITLNECACVLQYAQTCFEGLKAYTTEDGHIVTFRPDLNGERMENSAKGLEMPPFPKERFVDAITKVVEANAAFVPPYGSGATLYIRPYMFGYDSIIGVKPANIYQFRVFCTPVGPYFKGGAKPITIRVSDFDRAAPHGTGHIKAGLNYAMSLHAIVDAHKNGFDENIYLDPQTRTKIEETGGANVIFITKDGKLVTPKSNSILPSITRRSILQVARDYLGMETEEREVYLDEVLADAVDLVDEQDAVFLAGALHGGVNAGDDLAHRVLGHAAGAPAVVPLPDERQADGALAGVVGDSVGHQRNVALLRDLLHDLGLADARRAHQQNGALPHGGDQRAANVVRGKVRLHGALDFLFGTLNIHGSSSFRVKFFGLQDQAHGPGRHVGRRGAAL